MFITRPLSKLQSAFVSSKSMQGVERHYSAESFERVNVHAKIRALNFR